MWQVDNPDQRIDQDVDEFVGSTREFVFGGLGSVVRQVATESIGVEAVGNGSTVDNGYRFWIVDCCDIVVGVGSHN